MIERSFYRDPLFSIDSIHVEGDTLTIFTIDNKRRQITLTPDPDRDDHDFKLPILIDANRATVEGPYLRLYQFEEKVAEFTLRDVK